VEPRKEEEEEEDRTRQENVLSEAFYGRKILR
jgi:hypothetical protein